MNFLVLLLSISGALATPVSLDKRQSFGGGSTENDFLRGGCKDVIMIFARGTTEPGNIGNLVGPGLTDRLDRKYRNNFAMQGLDYPARLLDNLLPAGTTQQAINDMAKLFTDAATKCPNAKIVGGGYSQGTAAAAGAIQKLSETVKSRIQGVVLFGYVKNAQNGRRIPGFPTERTKIFCRNGADLVCAGTLTITPAHLLYGLDVPEAVDFIVSRIG